MLPGGGFPRFGRSAHAHLGNGLMVQESVFSKVELLLTGGLPSPSRRSCMVMIKGCGFCDFVVVDVAVVSTWKSVDGATS